MPLRFSPSTVALTDAATITVAASKGNLFTITLGGNRTLGNPTGYLGDGQKIIFRVKQDATGSRTLAFGSTYRFSTSLPSPTVSTASGSIDYLGFMYHQGDDRWDFVAQTLGF